jgi:hypothetical protein
MYEGSFGEEFGEHLYNLLYEEAPIELIWTDALFRNPQIVDFQFHDFGFRNARKLDDDSVLVEIFMEGEATFRAELDGAQLQAAPSDVHVIDPDRKPSSRRLMRTANGWRFRRSSVPDAARTNP